MDEIKMWEGAAKGLLMSMDFGNAERTILAEAVIRGELGSINSFRIIEHKCSDPEPCQAEYIDDRVEAWGDSPWEKRIPRDRSGNRTPRLQAKIKNRQKAKQAKASRKHNR